MDSTGAVGTLESYLGVGDLMPSSLVLSLEAEDGMRSSMEYDELTGRLWISAGKQLYGVHVSDGYRLFRSGSTAGEMSCLMIRHYPSGRNQIVT